MNGNNLVKNNPLQTLVIALDWACFFLSLEGQVLAAVCRGRRMLSADPAPR